MVLDLGNYVAKLVLCTNGKDGLMSLIYVIIIIISSSNSSNTATTSTSTTTHSQI